MKTLQNSISIILGIIMAVFAHIVFLPSQVHSTPLLVPTAQVTLAPKQELPATITIPTVNVQTSIDHVGLTDQKAMAEPIKDEHVAWFKLGIKPGERGNAVIAGHYDDENGPSVFYNLSQLKKGDEIIITDSNGEMRTFIVKEQETYSVKDFPIQQVFGKGDKKMLNLITCTGAFDQETEDYAERLVVYSELKK